MRVPTSLARGDPQPCGLNLAYRIVARTVVLYWLHSWLFLTSLKVNCFLPNNADNHSF